MIDTSSFSIGAAGTADADAVGALLVASYSSLLGCSL